MYLKLKNIIIFICLTWPICSFAIINGTNKEESFIKADKFYYNNEEKFGEAIGNVTIISGDNFIKTSQALIDSENKLIWVNSEIYAENNNRRLLASHLFIDNKNNYTEVRNVKILLNDSDLIVSKIATDHNHEIVDGYESIFSPCKVCINKKPIWQLSAAHTILDFKNKQISYHKASFSLAGYKIFFLPYFSHPTSNADAKSGILRPELDRNTLKVPFYYRAKPNMDITYTPRFNRKLFIHELEYRHMLENGQYQVNGSYTKSKVVITGTEATNKNRTYDRYYFNTKGDFKKENLKYGFNIGRVSDKSYLINYYRDYRTFVKSEFYTQHFQDNGYTKINAAHYQGLRTKDNSDTDPTVLPSLVLRRDYEFENNWNLMIKDYGIQYNENNLKNISRNRFSFNFYRNFYGNSGQILSLGFNNNLDIYKIQRTYSNKGVIKDKTITRNIPEFYSNVKWPFFYTSNKNSVVVVEPEVSFISGLPNSKKTEKYNLIDSPNIDINENNLFEASRYSGIDYHEFGNRLNYGINNYLMGDVWQLSTFIGQSLRSLKGKSGTRSNYVGKISYNYQNNFEIYYRFLRKNINFEPDRDEIGAWMNIGNLNIFSSYTSLNDLNEFTKYYLNSVILDKNYLRQNYTVASYKINDNWSISTDIRYDMTKSGRDGIVSNGYGVQYTYDCIALSLKLYNDYISDPSRNIKKQQSTSIGLGLKSINM